MNTYTYVAYLHGRQADCAFDKTIMDRVDASSPQEAEDAILAEHEAYDPEIITLLEGVHHDAR